jgi:hypothetical protein
MPDISEHTSPSRQQAVKVTPLAVSPRVAGEMLDFGKTQIFRLLKSGELKSFRAGGARRVLMSSISEYIARRIADPGPTQRGPKRKTES